jgi:hypothetical protein
MVARTSLGVDKALTRFAILNRNPEGVYIADMVLPKIGVMGRTGKLYTVNSGFRFASPSQGLKRLGGSAFKRFSMGVAQSSSTTSRSTATSSPSTTSTRSSRATTR